MKQQICKQTIEDETWAHATRKERAWWGNCTNTANEEAKQIHYAWDLMNDEKRVIKGLK